MVATRGGACEIQDRVRRQCQHDASTSKSSSQNRPSTSNTKQAIDNTDTERTKAPRSSSVARLRWLPSHLASSSVHLILLCFLCESDEARWKKRSSLRVDLVNFLHNPCFFQFESSSWFASCRNCTTIVHNR